MFKPFVSTIALTLFAQMSYSETMNAEQWALAIDEQNLKIYIKDIEGKEQKAFKAITHINASKETIFERVKDLPSYCEWFADCGEARFLKTISATESIGYFVNKTPWPVDDRDATFHRYLSTTESGGLKLTLIAESGHLELQECCVRLNDAEGYFLVEDHINGQSSKVTYEFYSDPGGNVPTWLINSMLTQSPTTTLTNLKKLVE